ncbi:glycosyltransferase family 2 protein [Litorisediminicola beolgyonensis]|uniref:Glycosyltransferase family 2 protein n=1 Tax=Litorisediminicola beolgyonensis TaxID=1173614 RepID=A0ABW3ZMS5_9RHOB
MSAPGLTLAIPVHDDVPSLRHLLNQANALEIFDHVIVSDDGSREKPDLPRRLPCGAGVELLRERTARGAGHARNRALERVRTSHVLFFDADDALTEEIARLWRAVAREVFDFCLFRHADSRVAIGGGWGQLPVDDALWRLADCSFGLLQEPSRAAHAHLAETANYPWNKIYRTDFLRAHDLRCTEIPVHNDIELHWGSFAAADRILVSNRVCALHRVPEDGARLTDRRGRDRLCLFKALAAAAARLETAGAAAEPLWLAFFRFSAGLFDWARSRIDPETLAAFEHGIREFLTCHLDARRYHALAVSDPILALRLADLMARTRAA